MADHDTLEPDRARELGAIDDALAGRPVDADLIELADLAVLLREARPAIDPGFATRLDARAAQGFAARRVRPAGRRTGGRLARLRPYLLPALGTAMLPLIVVLVVVAAGGDDSRNEAAGGGSVASQPTGGAEEGSAASSGSGGAAARDAAGGGAPPDGRQSRKVERSATLTLVAAPRDVQRVADGVVRVTDAVGGFVRMSSVAADASGGGGTFELRVPARRLNRALAGLSELAHVRDRSQATRDITGTYVARRERLRDARTERERLLRLLAEADTVNETSSIRGRLRIVRAEIAAAEAAVARTRNRAAFASIGVTLVSGDDAGAAGANDRWTPGDALRDAGHVLEVAAGVALVALALLTPLGVLAGLAVLTGRWVTHRRRERALDAV